MPKYRGLGKGRIISRTCASGNNYFDVWHTSMQGLVSLLAGELKILLPCSLLPAPCSLLPCLFWSPQVREAADGAGSS